MHRVFSISDKEHLQTIQLFEKNLTWNGYNKKEVNGTISKHRSETKNHWDTQQLQEELNKRSLSILPYVKGKTDRIGRILNKYNIRTIFKSPRKIE